MSENKTLNKYQMLKRVGRWEESRWRQSVYVSECMVTCAWQIVIP